jgi:hypothetical protein
MNELIKPEFEGELKANIKGIKTVEHNINIAKDFAIALKEYALSTDFTEDQVKFATSERAKINKMVLKITQYRKDIITEYKKPIDEFETIAKETEKILKEASSAIDVQVKKFEEKEWLEKQTAITKLIPDDYIIIWDDKWKNKGCTLDTINDEIIQQVNQIDKEREQFDKEVKLIQSLTTDEKYVERYKFTKDIVSIIDAINNDKKVVEPKQEETKEVLTGEVVVPIYSKTFYGSLQQLESLTQHAKNVLWMEVS